MAKERYILGWQLGIRDLSEKPRPVVVEVPDIEITEITVDELKSFIKDAYEYNLLVKNEILKK